MKILNKYNNPIFFISLFEPSYITLNDYSYTEIANNLKPNKGHIFAIFSPTIKSNLSTNEINDNKKLKIEISMSIEKVYLISESLNAFYKSGILIEYTAGEKCLFDNKKYFKAFIYLKCSKNKNTYPKILKTLDNECIYIFQWNTPYACKNCISKEIKKYKFSKCIKGLRNYYFSADEECLIFNGSDSNLNGYNLSYNGQSITFNNEFIQNLLFGEKEKSLYNKEYFLNNKKKDIKIEGVLKNFKYDYIEREEYIDKCYFFEDFSDTVKIIIFIISCIYIFIIILGFIFCCKYRILKIRHIINKHKNKENYISFHNKDFYKNIDI